MLGSWQELTGDINAYDIRLIGQTENYRVYKYDLPTKYTVMQYQDPEGYQCMSYTIESTDGGLVVVDGGRAWQSEELVNVIKEKGGKVDAWIITHPHDDHCGVLCSILAAEWDKRRLRLTGSCWDSLIWMRSAYRGSAWIQSIICCRDLKDMIM